MLFLVDIEDQPINAKCNQSVVEITGEMNLGDRDWRHKVIAHSGMVQQSPAPKARKRHKLCMTLGVKDSSGCHANSVGDT